MQPAILNKANESNLSEFRFDQIALFNRITLLKEELNRLVNSGVKPSEFNKIKILLDCYTSSLTAIIKLSKKEKENGFGL